MQQQSALKDYRSAPRALLRSTPPHRHACFHAASEGQRTSLITSFSSKRIPGTPSAPSSAYISSRGRQQYSRRAPKGSIKSRAQVLDTEKKLGNLKKPSEDSDGCRGFSITTEELASLIDRAGQGLPLQEIAEAVGTSLSSGLSDSPSQLTDRQQAFGSNKLPGRKEMTLLELLLSALDDFTVVILIISGVLSLVLDLTFGKGSSDWIEGAAILAAVAVVVLVTAVNDYQKEQQFRELSSLTDDTEVTVLRWGRQMEMSSADLLVGDVLLFGYGDILAVDGILIGGNNIRMDESALTGESEDVLKDASSAPFLQSSSKVLDGQGRMLVTAVGLNSQQGQIFGSLNSTGGGLREETALERKLDKLASQIGQFGLGAATVSLAAMAGQFTYSHFYVNHEQWQWGYLTEYLHFLITSITIVVRRISQIRMDLLGKLDPFKAGLVVAVPEGLPLAVTVALAYSVKRMLTDNNLVRRLSAAETMGCATTICTDKTGTLTQNDMTVTSAWIAGKLIDNIQRFEPPGESNGAGAKGLATQLDLRTTTLLSRAIALNCTAGLRRQPDTGELVKIGNRTECALLEFAERLGADVGEIERSSTRIETIPFSSERKRMTTIVSQEGASVGGGVSAILFTKGAAEIMLDLCEKKLCEDGSVSYFESGEKHRLLADLQSDGKRMLLIAFREVTLPLQPDGKIGSLEADSLEQELTLVAIVGISDPLRPEVVPAIQQCNRAGITVRMLTGDNAITASTIARQSGILEQEVVSSSQSSIDESHDSQVSRHRQAAVMEGQEFRRRVLDDQGNIRQPVFDEIWPHLRVLARCSPTDKLTIVKGLQANPEEVVAMTGDGTNDAPALKAADVGFAMNNGTSIAKEAADILLLDGNMLSIVKAVLWGRNVYAGITKFLQFQLVVNVVAVVTACTGAIVSQESPLTAVQMLWVNLIMDSLASLALATEIPTEELLDLPPFSPSASLLTPVVLKGIVGQCAFQLTVMCALVFHIESVFDVSPQVVAGDALLPGTIVFNTFVLMQLVNQVNARYINDEVNVLANIFTNKLFLGILGGELLLQVVIVQYGGEAFSTTALTIEQWAACAGFASLGFLVRAALLQIPPRTDMQQDRAK